MKPCGRRVREACLLLLMMFALPAARAMPAEVDQPLQLEVMLNGRATNKVGEFFLRQGRMMARREELRDLGVMVAASIGPVSGGALIDLAAVPGLTWRLDGPAQVLYLDIKASQQTPVELSAIRRGLDGTPKVETGTGISLNYDILSTFAAGSYGASGTVSVHAFTGWGAFTSSWLGYTGAAAGGSGANRGIPLDTSFEYADVGRRRRYLAGDFISSGLAWTRQVRLTGLQMRSDFSMRPDLITFPLPSVRGSAAVPSTLDVVANGSQLFFNSVEPGPFQISQLPVSMGAGTISYTVNNALGQQTTMTQSFYASPALLAPKLQTYAVEAGFLRKNWGRAGDEFGQVAASAVYRRGLNSKFTIESTAEGAERAAMGGVGGILQIGTLGVVNVSTAASGGPGHAGTQLSLGAQRTGRFFSVGGSAAIATRNYTDLAAVSGSPVMRKQYSASMGLATRHYGSFSVAYGQLNQQQSTTAATSVLPGSQSTRFLAANYSIQIHHMSLYANEFRNYAEGGTNNAVQIGLTLPFGRRGSAGVAGTTDGSVQVQIENPATQVGEWGYDAYASGGTSNHQFAQVQRKSAWGLVTGGVDVTAGKATVQLENQGAVTLTDHAVFPSNYIFDSFAIVDTDHVGRVHAFLENRDAGRTNSAGKLLVPDLRSFDLNHLSISPLDIPIDAAIRETERAVRPGDMTGVLVRFSISASNNGVLYLRDEAGEWLAVGTTVLLKATGREFPVGYGGETYLEGLSLENTIDATMPDGNACTATFQFHAVKDDIPVLGEVLCRRSAR